jgi:hypothetical protein
MKMEAARSKYWHWESRANMGVAASFRYYVRYVYRVDVRGEEKDGWERRARAKGLHCRRREADSCCQEKNQIKAGSREGNVRRYELG